MIAEWCGLDPRLLRPDESTLELHNRMKCGWGRGWDETGFLIKLEDALQKELPMDVKLPAFIPGRLFSGHSTGL